MIIMDDELKASRLMLVEDNANDSAFLNEILEQAGFHSVTSISDPREAVNCYQTKNFDLILLDILMPFMDGFELMQHFKSTDKSCHAPVLVVTGLEEEKLRIRALREGAQDFLEKSADPEELITRVSNTLRMHLSQKRLSDYSQTLEKAVRDTTVKLEKAQAEIVQRLSYAAEYRDSETANHTIRVGWYSKILASRLGYRNEECELLFDAAPMHDIGKIGIPDYILLKPGKLLPEEWEIMKTHTTIGGQIFNDGSTRLMKFAKTIALSHHEKWDGSGYPNGLSGEKIPIFGRIVMIADVFDALTTVRPYKPAWEIEKALELIREQSGTSFDPRLVKIFMDALPEIKEIYKNNPD